jgi:hypothetical protein
MVNTALSSTVPVASARLARRNLRSAASRAATPGAVRTGRAIAADLAAAR